MTTVPRAKLVRVKPESLSAQIPTPKTAAVTGMSAASNAANSRRNRTARLTG